MASKLTRLTHKIAIQLHLLTAVSFAVLAPGGQSGNFWIHPRIAPCNPWPSHHGMERPRFADGGDGLQLWRVAENILNKQSRTADKGWSSSLGALGDRITSPRRKKTPCYKMLHTASELAGTCEHGSEPSRSITGGEFLD
jgi:hypothetical protein